MLKRTVFLFPKKSRGVFRVAMFGGKFHLHANPNTEREMGSGARLS